MMILEFLSDSLNVLVWIACLIVGGVFVGVGVRYVCGLLMASLLETKRKCGVWVVSSLLAVALVCTVVAQKDGGANTNAPPDGVSGTNTVMQVEGGTNDWTNIEGTNTVGQTGGDGTNGTGSVSGPLMLGGRMEVQSFGVSPQDPQPGEAFTTRPTNAVENHWWRGRGAHVDGLTILAEGWNFRTPSGFLGSLLVYSYGEIQPDVETTYFPRPFPEADLSLLPEGKWGGNLPEGAESLFWYAASPSNSLILTWQNAAYNRDANCPTNLQIELFSNGTYVYRYDDRTEHYSVAYPFDLDGDGLENSVDPEPLVAGPDSHGTNAEWYDAVCSNVFASVNPNNANDSTVILPNGESVHFKSGINTNAYYFVDVVAERGPAPIYFNSSHLGRLGSPIVVALDGETNRVPMLIGATYSITSDVPFTVLCPTTGFAEVLGSDGMSATVKWPLEFTFTEELTGTIRSYTMGVEPYNPGGVFSWGGGQGGATLQGAPLPTGGACGCFLGNGNTVVFGCSPTCTCGGNCLAVGAFNFEHALFSVTGGVCRCGFDDPAPAEAPTYEPTAGASLAIAFSGPTVAFEGESGRASDALRTKKSTRVSLTVSAFGGPHGGTVTFTRANFGKLRLVGSGGFELPSPLTLAAGQSFFASCVCEGVEASASVNDIVVLGRLVEADTGTAIDSSASLTSCSVTFVTPTGDPAVRAEETDSGDGQNEFTFDDTTQTLTIGLKVRVEPDITQLANMGTCSFVLPIISGSDLFWTDNGGDLGRPTPQSADVGALVQATARYVGYPPSNSGFGRKTVTFSVLGLAISNDFEVFFPSDGTHHPACSTCPGCQNWFYYWREGGACTFPTNVVYSNIENVEWVGEFNPFLDFCIRLSKWAPYRSYKIKGKRYRRWKERRLHNPSDPNTEYFVPRSEYLEDVEFGGEGAGLKAVAIVINHEERHKDIYETLPDLLDRLPSDDEDDDGVLDSDEVAGRWGVVTELECRDTFQISRAEGMEVYRHNGDNEVRARKAEEVPPVYFPGLDWCNPGCQSHIRRGPDVDESNPEGTTRAMR